MDVCCRWEGTSIVARKVLATRYRLLPYLYTAFFDSHTYGCPVARPLFFTFPADNTTRNIAEQWMMGDALLVSPILYEKTTTVRAYFPKGTWYDFYSGRVLDATNGGKWDYVTVRHH
jgi:alpha-glucosidase (family GH31 glycosyl hydrolase)